MDVVSWFIFGLAWLGLSLRLTLRPWLDVNCLCVDLASAWVCLEGLLRQIRPLLDKQSLARDLPMPLFGLICKSLSFKLLSLVATPWLGERSLPVLLPPVASTDICSVASLCSCIFSWCLLKSHCLFLFFLMWKLSMLFIIVVVLMLLPFCVACVAF